MEDDLSAWKRTPGNSERRAMNLRVRMRLSRPGFDRHDDIPENGAVHLDTCDKPCSRQLSEKPCFTVTRVTCDNACYQKLLTLVADNCEERLPKPTDNSGY